MNAVVLVNPAAGRGRSRKKLEQVRRLCGQAGALILVTASAEETARRAREAAEGGCGRVIAAGGDGTVHLVLNGVAGTAAVLGIIPLGSGNDVARNLGVPRDVEVATRLALSGAPRRVDLGRIAWSDEDGRTQLRWFGGVASFGLDSHANRIANAHQRLAGTALYVYALLRTLAEWKVPVVQIESDAGAFRGPMMLAATANSSSYGGGMRIAPHADMADGRFDLCIVRQMSRLKLLRCFPEVFLGTHLRHPEITCLQASRCRVDADRRLEVFADGEFVGYTPAEVQLFPKALSVAAP